MARVVVVGLGPAGVDHLLPRARAVIESAAVRYVRTARHPAVAQLSDEGLDFIALDRHYEMAETIDDAYRGIVDELVDAAASVDAAVSTNAGASVDTGASQGEVVYAVPGSPVVAELTPALLVERGVEVVRVAGLSFADLAWVRLGVDPLRGATIADAHDVGRSMADVSGPLLIAQCDSTLALSDVKLCLLESLDAATSVTVLQRLGLDDESITTVPLEDLDRAVDPDHLTSVFVDTANLRVAGELVALYELVETFRGPGGCPWDAEQTHHSLARHSLEEAYEVVEAIERLPNDAPGGTVAAGPDDYAALCDELGDLLFQVFIHAVLAREAGAFTLADVARGIREKLVRRHPHVFGDVDVESSGEVVTNWEQIKKAERGSGSVMDGITAGLPSLVYSMKVIRKAESLGVRDDSIAGDSLPEALISALETLGASTIPELVRRDGLPAPFEDVVGELLAVVALHARSQGVDAETALRGWASRLVEHVHDLEQTAEAAGIDLVGAGSDEVMGLWNASFDRFDA